MPSRSSAARKGKTGGGWPAPARSVATAPQRDVHDPTGIRLQKVLATAGYSVTPNIVKPRQMPAEERWLISSDAPALDQ